MKLFVVVAIYFCHRLYSLQRELEFYTVGGFSDHADILYPLSFYRNYGRVGVDKLNQANAKNEWDTDKRQTRWDNGR
ncbi:MAG: hypothetical protein A2Z25_04540 [Planctomycetes bacterium RBG_16_55_9]|nr:MAG: hypothetical protein A2Z25_04540 [Planctomycetes bacterium RBG_16_55_9]